MVVKVNQPTEAEVQNMRSKPIWTCGVSEFDWYYDRTETCLLVEGEVAVTYDGGCVTFGAGDYVVLPEGLSCVWKVTKPVKKHYMFG